MAQEEGLGNESIDPGLEAFLDARTPDEKLEVLRTLQGSIDNRMVDIMAASLDTQVPGEDAELRVEKLKDVLYTLRKYELSRGGRFA